MFQQQKVRKAARAHLGRETKKGSFTLVIHDDSVSSDLISDLLSKILRVERMAWANHPRNKGVCDARRIRLDEEEAFKQERLKIEACVDNFGRKQHATFCNHENENTSVVKPSKVVIEF